MADVADADADAGVASTAQFVPLNALTVPNLRAQCRLHKLLVGGKKADLIARLQAAGIHEAAPVVGSGANGGEGTPGPSKPKKKKKVVNADASTEAEGTEGGVSGEKTKAVDAVIQDGANDGGATGGVVTDDVNISLPQDQQGTLPVTPQIDPLDEILVPDVEGFLDLLDPTTPIIWNGQELRSNSLGTINDQSMLGLRPPTQAEPHPLHEHFADQYVMGYAPTSYAPTPPMTTSGQKMKLMEMLNDPESAASTPTGGVRHLLSIAPLMPSPSTPSTNEAESAPGPQVPPPAKVPKKRKKKVPVPATAGEQGSSTNQTDATAENPPPPKRRAHRKKKVVENDASAKTAPAGANPILTDITNTTGTTPIPIPAPKKTVKVKGASTIPITPTTVKRRGNLLAPLPKVMNGTDKQMSASLVANDGSTSRPQSSSGGSTIEDSTGDGVVPTQTRKTAVRTFRPVLLTQPLKLTPKSSQPTPPATPADEPKVTKTITSISNKDEDNFGAFAEEVRSVHQPVDPKPEVDSAFTPVRKFRPLFVPGSHAPDISQSRQPHTPTSSAHNAAHTTSAPPSATPASHTTSARPSATPASHSTTNKQYTARPPSVIPPSRFPLLRIHPSTARLVRALGIVLGRMDCKTIGRCERVSRMWRVAGQSAWGYLINAQFPGERTKADIGEEMPPALNYKTYYKFRHDCTLTAALGHAKSWIGTFHARLPGYTPNASNVFGIRDRVFRDLHTGTETKVAQRVWISLTMDQYRATRAVGPGCGTLVIERVDVQTRDLAIVWVRLRSTTESSGTKQRGRTVTYLVLCETGDVVQLLPPIPVRTRAVERYLPAPIREGNATCRDRDAGLDSGTTALTQAVATVDPMCLNSIYATIPVNSLEYAVAARYVLAHSEGFERLFPTTSSSSSSSAPRPLPSLFHPPHAAVQSVHLGPIKSFTHLHPNLAFIQSTAAGGFYILKDTGHAIGEELAGVNPFWEHLLSLNSLDQGLAVPYSVEDRVRRLIADSLNIEPAPTSLASSSAAAIFLQRRRKTPPLAFGSFAQCQSQEAADDTYFVQTVLKEFVNC
ncbi:hypothetical protein DFS34DRAFT_664952 [Phlyctochytrium arcticum]|nr:hypothetical protein DFS34DRAFT_664952 [Phlyctochytrium arcticum]